LKGQPHTQLDQRGSAPPAWVPCTAASHHMLLSSCQVSGHLHSLSTSGPTTTDTVTGGMHWELCLAGPAMPCETKDTTTWPRPMHQTLTGKTQLNMGSTSGINPPTPGAVVMHSKCAATSEQVLGFPVCCWGQRQGQSCALRAGPPHTHALVHTPPGSTYATASWASRQTPT
jgi:hypothetical protein